MSQIDDVEAIHRYMAGQAPKTPAATTTLSQYKDWYNKSSWWDKNMSSAWYDEQRSRRNKFNIENAVTPREQEAVTRVLTTGMTAEEMQGKPRPAVDAKTGMVGTQVKNPTVPGVKVGTIAPGLSRYLKLGVKGDDVKQWQSFLGLTPPTGYFDNLTDKKTRDYQKAQGLKVDGVVGKDTWGKAFGEKASPFAPEAPKVAANIASAFKQPSAAPKASPVAQVAKAAIKAQQPAVKPTAKPAAAAVSAPALPLANKMPGLDIVKKIPWWAPVAGILGIGAAAVVGAKYIK